MWMKKGYVEMAEINVSLAEEGVTIDNEAFFWADYGEVSPEDGKHNETEQGNSRLGTSASDAQAAARPEIRDSMECE
jgi:hypothetical protein